MNVKERLHHAIDRLDRDKLLMLYGQVLLLQQLQEKAALPTAAEMTLDRILEMTRSSESSWAETLRCEREERG